MMLECLSLEIEVIVSPKAKGRLLSRCLDGETSAVAIAEFKMEPPKHVAGASNN
jgi:hypothetical protein